jgi:PAS domain S-box-containing protein
MRLSGTFKVADLVRRFTGPALAVDSKGWVVAVNEAMAACFAVKPARLVGAQFAAWAVYPAALRIFLREHTRSTAEFEFSAADGRELWLALSIAKEAVGNCDVVSATDVTPYRTAEQKALEDVSRFRDMIGAGSGWFYEVDSTLTQMRVLRRSEADGKLIMQELAAKFPDDVIDPTYDPAGYAQVLAKWKAREPSLDVIHRRPHGRGKEIYLVASSVPFYDGKGVYQGRRGVSIDVTRQVLAERALRRSQEHLNHAQRVSATGSVERDLVTGAVEWSDEMYRLYGVDRQTFALTDSNIFALIHEDDRERVKAIMMSARTGIRPSPVEFRILRADGEVRTLYADIDVTREEAGKPSRLMMVFKDVTELRAAQEQLLHSQKLEALGTLAGGVAHDINNLLVPILVLAKTMAKRVPEGSRERDNLDTIHQAGERTRDLVKQILAFGRKVTPARQIVDLGGLVADALKMLRAAVPSTIRIEERIAAVPPLMADPGRLHQVVTNLVTNAAQAIDGGLGKITVEVAPAPGERLPNAERSLKGAIRLSVSDTGCGMDKHTVTRIFEPFFTTKQVGQGTGLGLSMVHGIITQHGGRITVKSQVGQGTRFDVYFPTV